MGIMALILPTMVILGLYVSLGVSAYIEPTPVIVEQYTEVVPRVVLIGTEINWTPERIEQEIREVFYETPNTAVAIFKCESELKPDAFNDKNTNGTDDTGIAQINSVHDTTGYDLYDVQDNLEFARKLFDSKGQKFTDWVCYNQDLWQKHL